MKIYNSFFMAKTGPITAAVASAGALFLSGAAAAEGAESEATDSEGRTKTECLTLDTKAKLACLKAVQDAEIAELDEEIEEKRTTVDVLTEIAESEEGDTSEEGDES